MTFIASLLAAAAIASAAPAASPIEAPGPLAPLKGTLLMPAGNPKATVVIIPGSGGTDRDGNSPGAVAGAPYRQLADGLAANGIATVRFDKRGTFASFAAVADGNHVSIADYAVDAHQWAKAARARTGASCVWLLGHSEGGLVAIAAAQDPADICGLVLLEAPGRKLGDVIREQLRANPANAPLLDQAFTALASLEAGRRFDTAAMNPALLPLFAPPVQGYMIDMLSYDPAKLLDRVSKPVLIVQGERDIQVTLADARALAGGDPKAKLVLVPGANHVLKTVPSDDRAANLATYANPDLPLAPGIVDPIAAFVAAPPAGR